MSTTELFLSQEDEQELVAETKQGYQKGYQFFFGDFAVNPFISMYIFHTDAETDALVDQVIILHQELHKLADLPYKIKWYDPTQKFRKVKNQEDVFFELKEDSIKTQKKETPFYIGASAEENAEESARWALSAQMVRLSACMSYSNVKIHFRWSWYLQNPQKWHNFVVKWLNILKPEQCYSSFEVGTPVLNDGGYENGVMERTLADYFYGVDIDHPLGMGYHSNRDEEIWSNPSQLGSGLRPATWGILLSSYWLKHLGKSKEEVSQTLSRWVNCTQLNDGLWLEIGDKPQLYPVEEGVPEALVAVNAYLKPILNDQLKLYVLDPWDDDPNPRFDFESGELWLRRFEVDSHWPSQAIRDKERAAQAAQKEVNQQQFNPKTIVIWGGNAATETGYWICPNMLENDPRRRQFFNQGEMLPKGESSKGSYVWHYQADKKTH